MCTIVWHQRVKCSDLCWQYLYWESLQCFIQSSPNTHHPPSRSKRVGWEPSAKVWQTGNRLWTMSLASLASSLAALTYLLPEANWGPWKPNSLCFPQERKNHKQNPSTRTTVACITSSGGCQHHLHCWPQLHTLQWRVGGFQLQTDSEIK